MRNFWSGKAHIDFTYNALSESKTHFKMQTITFHHSKKKGNLMRLQWESAIGVILTKSETFFHSTTKWSINRSNRIAYRKTDCQSIRGLCGKVGIAPDTIIIDSMMLECATLNRYKNFASIYLVAIHVLHMNARIMFGVHVHLLFFFVVGIWIGRRIIDSRTNSHTAENLTNWQINSHVLCSHRRNLSRVSKKW